MDWLKHFCAKDCPDTCGFLAKLENENLLVKPYDWDFLDKPFVCRKLKFFYEREIKNNDAYPFIQSKRVSNDAVLNEVARFLKDTHKSSKRVLYYRGSGNLGYGMYAWDLLMSKLENVYFVDGSPCDETGIEAHIEDFGVCTNPPISNLEKAETIMVFGKNAFVCSPHLYAYLHKLKTTKTIIYIDPVTTQTSKLAHIHIQNKPGSDGVIANAILSVLGFEKQQFDNLEKATGITEEELKILLDAIKPNKTAIIEGYGLQRYTNGKNTIKWLNRLAYHTDNLDLLYYSRSSKEGLKKPKITPKNRVYISEVTDYLKDDFFDAIFVVAANLVMSLPNNDIWESTLEKCTTIVVDTNFTQTTKLADFFIKVDGMFTQRDIQGSYFFNKILEKMPIKKGFTDVDAAKELAKRLNYSMNFSAENVDRESIGERKRKLEPITLKLPENENGKIRLLSLPHPSYLNSQCEPLETEAIYLPKNIAREKYLKEDKLVIVKNGDKKAQFILKTTDKIKGNLAFVYKSRCKSVNYIFNSKPTDTKRGIAYNDTFIEI